MKPKKIPYNNQQEIKELITQKLKVKYLKNVKKAFLIGSLANGNFGVYEEIHEGHLGSDIDIVIIPLKIEKNWKYKGEFYGWHKGYHAGEIRISKVAHPINIIVPLSNDIKIFFKKAKELNWKMEKLK